MNKTQKKNSSELLDKHNNSSSKLAEVFTEIMTSYLKVVPKHIQVIDWFISYLTIITIAQLIYCIFIGMAYPLNSFIAGIFTSGGTALLVLALRIQLIAPELFDNISPKTAIFDFLICSFVFFIGCASLLV
ncbi:DAD family protein [Cryptosporidium andersoni]|uniref:Dolichyl-diphosphooligosaccharide--protein glycosyltransferase subunit OST2 n=1 Tax=Cryptosporidium andersoni TaxID=117008 RepID=A0A1J4MZ09_9CRYT|nr:DAD family protein [Cryptosporidium andersoni]